MHRSTVDLKGLLRALCEQEIAFVIVGGAAAVLHGALTTTQDLDIVPEQSEANLDRLLAALLSALFALAKSCRRRRPLQAQKVSASEWSDQPHECYSRAKSDG